MAGSMSRQSISMKLKSNAKGKARGKTKRKEVINEAVSTLHEA